MDAQREDEFVRNPILEHQVFFLKSACNYCGYLILAGSAAELADEEEQHARECKARQGAVRLVIWRTREL